MGGDLLARQGRRFVFFRKNFIAAVAAIGLAVGGLSVGPVAALAPANDNFADRATVTQDTFTFYDATQATFEALDYEALNAACNLNFAAGNPPLFSVWYDFTAATSGPLLVENAPSAVVVTGNPGAFVGQGCSLNGGDVFNAVAGTTYHIAIGGFSPSAGSFIVTHAPAPPTVSVTLNPTATVDFNNNTVAIGGTITCTGSFGASVQGIAQQANGRYIVNGFIGGLAAPCDGTPQPWTALSDSPTGLFSASPLTVGGLQATACNAIFTCVSAAVPTTVVTLIVGAGTPPPPPPPPPPPANLTVTVDPTGVVNLATNTVTLTGIVTCSGGGEAIMFGELRQVYKKMFIDGFMSSDLGFCDGTVQHWSVQLTATAGLYGAGTAALINTDAFQCDVNFNNCFFGAVNATVTLTTVGDRPPFRAPGTSPSEPTLIVNVDHGLVYDPATNIVTVTGNSTCIGFPPPELFFDVEQLVGRIFVGGHGFVNGAVPCNGIPHRFAVPVAGSTGFFGPGRAVLTGSGEACGDSSCALTPVSANVHLMKRNRSH